MEGLLQMEQLQGQVLASFPNVCLTSSLTPGCLLSKSSNMFSKRWYAILSRRPYLICAICWQLRKVELRNPCLPHQTCTSSAALCKLGATPLSKGYSARASAPRTGFTGDHLLSLVRHGIPPVGKIFLAHISYFLCQLHLPFLHKTGGLKKQPFCAW